MMTFYKNLILSSAIILISAFGVFAQSDDKKPKDDGPKIVVRPKPDERPKEKPPKNDDQNKDKKPKPNSILDSVKREDILGGIMKVLIG